MTGIFGGLLATSASVLPVTRTYTTGTAATETVPTGATSCTITVDGAGGSGAYDDMFGLAAGGGGSGRAVKTTAVTGGNTFTYTVAPQVAGVFSPGLPNYGTDGAASTVSGTPSGGALSMSGGGGQGGRINDTSAGGTASGGTTNTSGSDGGIPDGGVAASGAAASVAPGGGGDGSGSVTSGVGARGQISFAYT